jgi:ribosomal protein L40E
MSGGFYCPDCGATFIRLPSGVVVCRRCGGLGLRGYDRQPRRVSCDEHPDWRGWDDGGVNDDLGRHRRREHSPVIEKAS